MKEYRTVTAKLSASEATDGLLVRMVGSDAAGLHIIDIWESQAKRFEAEQLFPAFHRNAGSLAGAHRTGDLCP